MVRETATPKCTRNILMDTVFRVQVVWSMVLAGGGISTLAGRLLGYFGDEDSAGDGMRHKTET
jgi:hypothetical protein